MREGVKSVLEYSRERVRRKSEVLTVVTQRPATSLEDQNIKHLLPGPSPDRPSSVRRRRHP